MSTADVEANEPAEKTKNKAKTNAKAAKMAATSTKGKVYKTKDRLVKDAAALLKQSGDVTRVAILLNLTNENLCVSDICSALGNPSQPAVSHHLALLKHGALVEVERSGKNNYYELTVKGKRLVKAIRSVLDSAE